MKIAIAHTKGGVGKSNVAVHLATHLASQNHSTLLLDVDPQASAAGWAAIRQQTDRVPSPTVSLAIGPTVYDIGQRLSKQFDYTVFDAGGRDSAGLRSALALADLLVIPVQAGGFDSMSMGDFEPILKDAQKLNPGLKVKVLMSKIDPRVSLNAKMQEFLTDSGFHVMNTRIHERVSYRYATAIGSTVHEMDADPQAIAEMNGFFKEILQ